MPSPLILQRLALADADVAPTLCWHGDAAVLGSGGLTVPAGATADLGTWWNAAPLGWWARLGVARVRLVVTGTGAVTVRTALDGVLRTAGSAELRADEPWTLDLATDADWGWVELAAPASGDGTLAGVEWQTAGTATPQPLTVVVPTFRAEDDALAQLARLTGPGLDDVVGRVVVVDQGGTLAEHPGTARALAAAGDRVLLVEQPNLGGSGGYSRGLWEAARRWPESPVFLHDDDAVADAESLRRLTVLAALAPRTFFGTGLLDADAPTRLQALAEGVERRSFRWGPTDGVAAGADEGGVDVGSGSPGGWTFTRPGDGAQYGGWWGCLVPAGASDDLGLAAPFFLKWDDAEYGLRAGRAGYDVRTLPGFAVRHPTWATKGTSSSWSSWPLHRNRLATAAAYGAGVGVLADSFAHQVKHVLSLQYATAELWNAALAEAVGGTGWLEADLTAVRPRAQALLDAMPAPPVVGLPVAEERAASTTPGRATAAARAVTGLVRAAGVTGPEGVAHLAGPSAFGWSDGLGRDAVVFADGAAPLVRDPRRARRALARTVRLHLLALARWGRLRRAYAEALPRASTTARWLERFGADVRA
ncbi:glycosyltransferase [Luteimicrobium sp. NPDC057192]|uniref:glycosyltransferase n=1 Tax=Luteimicrobium sp. NPDC057192 TaxID=3346042 RepID=UPI003637F83B